MPAPRAARAASSICAVLRPACSWSSHTASKPPCQATISASFGEHSWPSRNTRTTRSCFSNAFRCAPMGPSFPLLGQDAAHLPHALQVDPLGLVLDQPVHVGQGPLAVPLLVAQSRAHAVLLGRVGTDGED